MYTACKKVYLTDICIGFLFILSMVFVFNIEIAGFPLYVLILFLSVSVLTVANNFLDKQEKRTLFFRKDRTAIAALIVIGYELALTVFFLFADAEKDAIDFSANAVAIAFALLYLVFSERIICRKLYFEIIVYSGLLVAGVFIFGCVTGRESVIREMMWENSGEAASYLLLVCMCSVYLYCFCKDRLRASFYLLVFAIALLALLLNHDILSFWVLAIYFLAMPIVLRPTAKLVKRDMQLFFLFVFMLSNRSLLMGNMVAAQEKIPSALQHSMYIDLLLLIGGLIYFRYWEEIPGKIDLERLVLRKMRRGYQVLLRTILLFLSGTIIAGEPFHSFVAPLLEGIRQNNSSFSYVFRQMGMTGGIMLIALVAVLARKMCRKFAFDRPVTGFLILVSSIFLLQLLFWTPDVNTVTIYLLLFLFAIHYEEARMEVTSIKLRKESLKELYKNTLNIQPGKEYIENEKSISNDRDLLGDFRRQ